jgi:hypothetical protein
VASILAALPAEQIVQSIVPVVLATYPKNKWLVEFEKLPSGHLRQATCPSILLYVPVPQEIQSV